MYESCGPARSPYTCDAKGDTPNPTRGCVSVKTGMSGRHPTEWIPSAVSSFQNNLPIGNMDFEEFADSADGVFRGS